MTPLDKVRVISGVPGREVRHAELSRDGTVARWHREGYADEDVAFFLTTRTGPPDAGRTVLPDGGE
ncbi:hypothetical protein [Streptomyces albogriseolus]|uniref:hypothetical protein n=1 Tax=Streptomyces albogriseolus TaxID=1887 RepID=UPI0033B36BEF